ncbi:inositol 1,4,5-trisphosphate receptor-interacting protein isoform X2 [Mugil cephalus]|uniref:inositol 1,4,5-trisphosphate receptor-interacting protein isoform X2 n=1 Tax=Mugil cephalus TaxID=48193 RepID=UPI001FB71F44|nr:inositol 1,4,5-trisphosphate receptor-interacting protein isoform X2 [Mugil cephalus]
MMQDFLLRVFVVTLGILTYPREDPGFEEWGDIDTVGVQDERLLRGEQKMEQEIAPNQSDQRVTEKDNMSDPRVTGEKTGDDHKLLQEHLATTDPGQDGQTDGSFREKPEREMLSSREQEEPFSHVKTSDNDTSEKLAEWERDYLWYIWNAYSIISIICFLKKYLRRNSQTIQNKLKASSVTYTVDGVQLPDSRTLQQFHAKYVRIPSEKKWREEEFLEGFAYDLLEAMESICDKNGGMMIEDFQMGQDYNIIVPFTPPKPYSFQCQLWNNQPSDTLSDMQVWGQIKLVENKKIPNGCPCQSADIDDDTVCLLHGENEKVKTKITDVSDGLLCSRGTPFLSKSQVTRWFQSTIKEAWALISHKYEFELNIRYIDAPGSLVIRFRSGKKISFTMNPVVKFDTNAHFFITPECSSNTDIFWTLSLSTYEDHLLEHLSKRLPENSCHIQTLEIASFLHQKETVMSGSSVLKDFHFKAALMHLLLTKTPSQWKPDEVDCRLRDLLAFMESSLEKKLLNHVLIGNPLAGVIELPAEFKAKSMNLFHPLVVHNCMYRNAVSHFQEMLRNADLLIHDYAECANDFI